MPRLHQEYIFTQKSKINYASFGKKPMVVPIHSMKFSAFIGDEMEYNGSQGASGSD